MLTVEKLKEFGANTEEGLGRCLGNEPFYLRMVGMALAEGDYDALKAALDAGDTKAAFEEAHKLKGVLGNLSLTPMYNCAVELTEILRADSLEGADAAFEALAGKRAELLALSE